MQKVWALLLIVALGMSDAYLYRALDEAAAPEFGPIPPQSAWPKALPYTLNASVDYKSVYPPANSNSSYYCPAAPLYSADWYWSLCPHDPNATLTCNHMMMYALARARDCIEYRDALMNSDTSTLNNLGFWSSRCRCMTIIPRILNVLSSMTADGWPTCSSVQILTFEDLYRSKAGAYFDTYIAQVNSEITAEVNAGKLDASLGQTYMSVAGRPWYINLLDQSQWQCTLGAGLAYPYNTADYYAPDMYAYTSLNVPYLHQLFFARPPPRAYVATPTAVPTANPTAAVPPTATPTASSESSLSRFIITCTLVSLMTINIFVALLC